MGNFSLENQGTYSFLVYELSPDDVLDTLCLGMITHNTIPGISPAVFTQMDDKKYIKYNISAKVSLDQFLLGIVRRKRLLGVFSSLTSAFLSADDYMIDINTLLMDTQYMYADIKNNSAVLICLPVAQAEKPPIDLQKFFKNIMFSTQFDQSENCDYIAQILNDLNGSSQFSIIDFKKMIDKLSGQSNVHQGVASGTQAAAPHDPERMVSPAAPVMVPPVEARPVLSQQTPVPPVSPKAQPISEKAPAVPQRPAPAAPQAPARVPQDPNQPDISLFYLLQHYNKDNAAIYNQQKEQMKANKPGGKAPAPSKPAKQQPPKAPPARSAGYAVPGMANPPAPAANMSQARMLPNAQPSVPAGSPSGSMSAAAPIFIPKQEMQQKPASFGETTVLGVESNDGGTTLLSEAACQSIASLIRIKTNERILIKKDVFKIGKNSGYVDYVVADNAAVSRSHADILFRDGKYYILDNNSTNHTYLNGKQISGNTPTELKDGYSVSLANELFRFEQ